MPTNPPTVLKKYRHCFEPLATAEGGEYDGCEAAVNETDRPLLTPLDVRKELLLESFRLSKGVTF
jgi:hypothetical protein